MKKNIPVILWTVFFTVAIIYSVCYFSYIQRQKLKVKQVCKEFIDICAKYTMLEDKYRKIPLNISDDEYELYKNKIYKMLSSKMINNKEYRDYQYQVMVQNLDFQVKDKYFVIENIKKDIIEFESFNFGNKTVSVKIKCNEKVVYLKEDKNGKVTKSQKESYMDDVINLALDENEWKVVSSKLYYTDVLNKGILLNGFFD